MVPLLTKIKIAALRLYTLSLATKQDDIDEDFDKKLMVVMGNTNQ